MHLTIKGLKEKGDVNGLIAALKDKNYILRKDAAQALGELADPRAIEQLVSALQYRGLSADKDLPVRVAAAIALGKLGDPQAIEPLVAILQGRKFAPGDVPVRSAIVTALGDLANPLVVEPLITALKDAPIRDSVVVSFGKLGDYALEPLLKALKDKDKTVRMSAAAALGELGNPQGVEPLIAALGDNQSSVRSAAAAALGKLGDLRSVQPLLAAFHDKDGSVRSSIANALGKLGDPRAVELLTAALQDKDVAVRTVATTALKKFIDEQPARAFTPTHPDHKGVTPDNLATTNVNKLGTSQSVTSFITALQDQGISGSVRASAADTLGELGDPHAVEPLIAALKDNDPSVRAAVVAALKNLGDPRAVEPLVLALWDSHSSVRNLAANALEKLSDPRTVELLIMKVRDKYSCGQIPVKSIMVKTGVRPPAIPEYCVGCGGPPPLVVETFGKEVSVTISLGGKDASGTQGGYQNFMTQKYPLHFYLCEHCVSRESAMKPLKKKAKIISYCKSRIQGRLVEFFDKNLVD